MKRVERDFVCLFNSFWYQDFPVRENEYINRANWTIHLGLVVRQCANLLGARTFFEQGGRTDAVLRYPDGQLLSYVEWEWTPAHKDSVNELDQLQSKNDDAYFCTFISYTTKDKLPDVIERASAIWKDAEKPLIFFIITYRLISGRRCFEELQTHVFNRGRHKRVRKQPALPWDIVQRQYNNAEDGD